MTASPEKKPRIVLIDDHPKALMAASQIMKDEFEIVGGSYVVKRRMRTDLMTAAREAMRGNLFFSPILPS